MDDHVKTSLWLQFGAAIDMLEDALVRCPDHLWSLILWDDPDDARYGQVWFIAYHTLRWLDLFLTGSEEGFAPPPPFLVGALPEQPYTKEDVLSYVALCRRRCQSTIETMTDEKARQPCTFEWMEPSFLELQLYSMRHVQEHASQLSLALGRQQVTGFDWIPRALDKTRDPAE